MDKYALFAVLAVIAIGAFSLSSLDPFWLLANQPEKDLVKIGVVVPLSGKQAEYGQGIMEGLELALQEINQNPANDFKIELIYEDNAGEVKNSVSSAQKLIAVDGATAIITGVSQHSLAVAPVAEEKQVVLYTMASQAKELSSAGDYVFKNDDDLRALGKFAAEKLYYLGHRKVALLFAEYNDATVDAKGSFVEKFSELGGTVVAVEGYGINETDFRAYLAKIDSAKPTALFLDTIMGDNINVLKQFKELGLGMKLFANGTVESQEVIDGAGNAAEGIIFFTFQGFPSEAFVEKTEARYGHYPKRWSMEAYDGLKIIAEAISKIDGKIDSESLKEQLSKIREYSGESGPITFDGEGNAQRSIFVKKIEEGKFVPFE